MDENELARREREADEALYAVDPDFARELGYAPPPSPDPTQQTLRYFDPDLSRKLGCVPPPAQDMLSRLANSYVPPQHLGQAARQDRYGSGHALGSLVGGGFGAALGGAILGPIFGRRR